MGNTLDIELPLNELEDSLRKYQDYCKAKGLDTTTPEDMLNRLFPAVRDHIFSSMTAWNRVQLARHLQRPYPMDFIKLLFTDYMELHGDRRFADDRAIVGGFARLDTRPVMLIATRKGRNLKQNIENNFGSGHPEGYRKALRLMQLADKARCPIICLVDTPGAFPGVGAEERHIGEAIAVNLREMFRLRVPVLCIITGEGGSGGALALSVANRLLIMEYAYLSVITPEGCSAILWRTSSETPRAAEALKLTSHDMLRLNIADAVVPEPPGGAHRDWTAAAKLLKQAIIAQLDQLDGLSESSLKYDRYQKFRRLGVFYEPAREESVTIREATENDIDAIEVFFKPFVLRHQILPRTPDDIRAELAGFTVAVDNGQIVGTVALSNFGDGLVEVRSLAVDTAHEGLGIGTRLIEQAVENARAAGASRIFTLTMHPDMFLRLGFAQVCIMRFPGKVQKDCEKCTKRHVCDEVALLLELNGKR